MSPQPVLSVHSSGGHETLGAMRFPLGLLLLAVLFLSACDGYIEELRVQSDGSVEFAAEAIVVCTDELQREIWGGDPCDQIDTAIRTGEIGDLPFDFDLDPNRVSLVGSGEADRRTSNVSWSGTADEFSSLLAGPGRITRLNEEDTEVIFSSAGTPAEALQGTEDPDLRLALVDSGWDPGEFRINAPDLVIDHNGDEIEGRIVRWNLDGDQPEEFRVVFTTADPPFRWWWWAIGGTALLLVLAMIVKLEEPPKRQPRKNVNNKASKAKRSQRPPVGRRVPTETSSDEETSSNAATSEEE